MKSDVINKTKKSVYFRLNNSHLKNMPVEYYNEVESKGTHTLLLPKDEQASLEKSNKSENMQFT